ncbi:MAG: hypothetical protein QM541_13910 [Flavobacterium sp.]|nr:hypothetical protein [Flavobacterium sp.]
MVKNNDSFKFSKKDLLKIRSLNAKLKQEETRIKIFADELTKNLNTLKTNKKIDDFNFKRCLSVFTSNKACNKRHGFKEDGDPIYEESYFSLFSDNKDDTFYNDNWNELPPEHPLGNEYFCYSMHCILFHAHELSWQDVLAIDSVWIDLKIDYQFTIDL